MPVSTSSAPMVLLDPWQVGAEARKECRERLDREGRDQKRDAEAERIDREQARALGDRRLGCRDREDHREDRPDARRPAEREGEPHHIGAPQADRLRRPRRASRGTSARSRHAEEMQPHHDDDDAGDDRELVRIGADQRSRTRWRSRRARRTWSRSRPRTGSAAPTVSPPHPRSGSASASRSSDVPAR